MSPSRRLPRNPFMPFAHPGWAYSIFPPSNIRGAVQYLTSFLSPTYPGDLNLSFIVPLLPVALKASLLAFPNFYRRHPDTSTSNSRCQWPHETTLFPHGPTHHIASKHDCEDIWYTNVQSALFRSPNKQPYSARIQLSTPSISSFNRGRFSLTSLGLLII